MFRRTLSLMSLLLFLSSGAVGAQSSYKVGDIWIPPAETIFSESFSGGFAGWTSNSTNYLWHTQPLAASPSGVQVYDNILSGNTTWAMPGQGQTANCLGVWNADKPGLLPAVGPGPMPCVAMTAHYVSGAWHSGMIASTNPDGTAIAANPAGTLGNRFVVQVLARLPDTSSGQVLQGFTPAIWINNAKAASGGCTTELDVVENFGFGGGGNFYHFSSRHCWSAGVDQSNVTVSLEDSNSNVGLSSEVDDITAWHWWILDARDPRQFVWVRDSKVIMVALRDANSGDVSYDLMISNQVGCCGWPAPTDTTKTATMQVAAIIIR